MPTIALNYDQKERLEADMLRWATRALFVEWNATVSSTEETDVVMRFKGLEFRGRSVARPVVVGDVTGVLLRAASGDALREVTRFLQAL